MDNDRYVQALRQRSAVMPYGMPVSSDPDGSDAYGQDVVRGVVKGLGARASDFISALRSPRETLGGIVETGKQIVRDPKGSFRAVAQAEALRAANAASDPSAAGEYAASFLDPLRFAKVFRGVQDMPAMPESKHTTLEQNNQLMQRMRELYGDFAQAYNLGLPDTPEYRRIVQEVTAQGPLSDDAFLDAVRAHPGLLQAGGKARASEMRQANRGGAAALVDSLTGQGIKTRVETSKSPGSRSTYIYASKGDKTVKIRLSDHLPAESGRVYGANDIMTTPQHWKSAEKRALELLGEAD